MLTLFRQTIEQKRKAKAKGKKYAIDQSQREPQNENQPQNNELTEDQNIQEAQFEDEVNPYFLEEQIAKLQTEID